jgi:hypothetical protein
MYKSDIFTETSGESNTGKKAIFEIKKDNRKKVKVVLVSANNTNSNNSDDESIGTHSTSKKTTFDEINNANNQSMTYNQSNFDFSSDNCGCTSVSKKSKFKKHQSFDKKRKIVNNTERSK